MYKNILSIDVLFLLLETKDQHASAKAWEAVDHLASLLSCREEISHPRINPANPFLEIWISPHHHPID
jgi:hypothetical protein